MHAAAVITVNNYRDLDGDAKNGKNTLAVRLGRPATCRIYAAEMLAPYACCRCSPNSAGRPFALLSLPLACI
jgi:1,4-dihydroxy-2-naphthoate octaprenyltransferase